MVEAMEARHSVSSETILIHFFLSLNGKQFHKRTGDFTNKIVFMVVLADGSVVRQDANFNGDRF